MDVVQHSIYSISSISSYDEFDKYTVSKLSRNQIKGRNNSHMTKTLFLQNSMYYASIFATTFRDSWKVKRSATKPYVPGDLPGPLCYRVA